MLDVVHSEFATPRVGDTATRPIRRHRRRDGGHHGAAGDDGRGVRTRGRPLGSDQPHNQGECVTVRETPRSNSITQPRRPNPITQPMRADVSATGRISRTRHEAVLSSATASDLC